MRLVMSGIMVCMLAGRGGGAHYISLLGTNVKNQAVLFTL